MLVGILFTVLVSCAIGSVSGLAFFTHYHVRARHENRGMPYYAIFWLVMSAVWFTAAASDLLSYIGMDDAALFATYILQMFVGISLVVAAYFLGGMFLSRVWANAVLWLYMGLFSVFMVLLFSYGFRPFEESFFSNQIIMKMPPLIVFLISVSTLWAAVIPYFFWSLRQRHRLASSFYRFNIFASSSLFLLGLSGSIDELGIIGDWSVTATRLVTLIAGMVAYLAVAALHEPSELVI